MNLPTPFLHPTDEPDVYDLHVDNSAKELFETCARAAEYYTVQRRESGADRPALNFGNIIHKALVPRKLGFPDWAKEQERIIIDNYMELPTAPEEWRTCERAIDTIHQYNKAYPIETEPFKIISGSVEMGFKLPLGIAELDSTVIINNEPIYIKRLNIFWTGRIDGIVEYGSTMVLDHKTTSVLGPTFYDDFVLSSQMHGYTWAARKLGYDVRGLLLDVLALRKPSKSGTPTEFQRQRYFYFDEHLAEWEKDTFTLITDFLEHLCRNYFPKSPKWCHGKYGKCQYWHVCTSLPDQRQGVLNSDLYHSVTWDPLNENHPTTIDPISVAV